MASRRLRRTVVLACLAVVVSGYPQAARAEDRQLFMLVTDPSDQPLLDIRTDEVDLQMAGAECTIRNMHLDGAPMKVALLVDNSHAARQSLIPLRAGLNAFLIWTHGSSQRRRRFLSSWRLPVVGPGDGGRSG